MTWIEKKKWFEPKGWNGRRRPEEKTYTIMEMAAILSVSRDTIYKWIAFDAPDEAVIPPSGWIRLPNGRVRIHEWVLIKIKNGENVNEKQN